MDKPLYMKDRHTWRAWLMKNHAREKQAWLMYHKKHSKVPSVKYNEAVEEAICFGWIDGLVNRLDEDRYIQRYTPRNPKSGWSEPNVKRAEKMISEGKMQPSGLKLYRDAMEAGRRIPTVKNFTVPNELKAALIRAGAWEKFKSLRPSVQLMHSYHVASAKMKETKERRIRKAIAECSAKP